MKDDKTCSPLVSIIIANYNYGRFLEDAIQSIIAQDMGDEVELIICDAASTDNSVEIIKKYANGLPPNTPYAEWMSRANTQLPTNTAQLITWWCSEADGGQSAAFNKGFSHARGKFLTWLNADDVLLPGTIDKLKEAIEKYPECEWFVGGVLWLDVNLRVFKCGRARRMSHFRAKRGLVNVCGPSSFFSKDLYERAGKIDERFKYTMDSDLWLRFAIINGVTFKAFVKYAWGLRLHPDAKMSGHKVTADGKILDGHASELAFARKTDRQRQLDSEYQWSDTKIGFVRKRIPWVLQLASADVLPALMSRVDSFYYKGHLLCDVVAKLI